MFAKKSYIAASILIVISPIFRTSPACAQSSTPHEYRVKAAFIYQFVNFIDGWKFQNENGDRSIFLGVIGDNPFHDAFEPLKDKQIKNRYVTIKYFKGLSELDIVDETMNRHPDIEEIQKCDIVFICSSEKQYLTNILNSIRYERILTISETEDFLEKGGILNFCVEKNKIRFETNTAGAHREKLNIRSKLLRLAKRILTTDNVEER